ncbi:MAG: VIT1/CCC1 transporter family protein [Spirochaetales bacterium]|nr:VIT1/CCC1 transporter family protein [Spirochaetales bacterium]
MDGKKLKMLKQFQKEEITASIFYGRLAKIEKDENNRKILEQFSRDEAQHYEMFKKFSGVDVKPNRFYARFVVICARVLGLTFVLKMVEKLEEAAQKTYSKEINEIDGFQKILADEERHEQELLKMIQEERLEYVGSIVLGLNDALVELTGALAGYTFAFQNTHLIALTGLITGIAASLSMASSEFLSHRAEENSSKAFTASVYTGMAYIITVILLVLPFLLMENFIAALGVTLGIAVLIIAVFNFYISVAKEMSFIKHFLEMAGLSLGVSALSFGIGVLVRVFIGIEI